MQCSDKIEEISKKLFVQPQDRFINRELSWLAFNTRVLEEAMNPNVPLLERVNFLAISASNLDEFYMVRVAGLKDQLRTGMQKRSADGLAAEEQLDRIYAYTEELMDKQQQCWKELKKAMHAAQVDILQPSQLEEKDRKWLRQYFRDEIFSVLTPIAIDPAHPFPFLPNLGKALLLHMQNGDKKSKHNKHTEITAVIPLPPKLKRFIRLGAKRSQQRFVMLEDVILDHITSLFPGAEIIESGMVSVVRDSDLDIEEEAEDLVGIFERAVKRRRRGRAIRLKGTTELSESLLNLVVDQLQVRVEDVIRADVLGLTSLRELYACDRPELKFPPFKARFPERISDYGGDCFAAIHAKDIVVHHPFESFDVVVDFLRQAAADPNVLSIKQTLYRTSSDSPIVKALVEAAEVLPLLTTLGN
ncbi:MAG: RNA degradosome polyphosphate kinase, partial [Rickettsiales bacterium]